MSPLEPMMWALIAFVVLILVTVVRNLLNPPKVIPWTAVPGEIRETAEAAVPGFIVESVKYAPVSREYTIKGSLEGRKGRIEVELNKQGGIHEVEFEESGNSPMVSMIGECEFSEIPAPANALLMKLLGPEAGTFTPYRTTKGKAGDGAVYEVKGRTSGWKWEVEMTGEGRLLELEKERRR